MSKIVPSRPLAGNWSARKILASRIFFGALSAATAAFGYWGSSAVENEEWKMKTQIAAGVFFVLFLVAALWKRDSKMPTKYDGNGSDIDGPYIR